MHAPFRRLLPEEDVIDDLDDDDPTDPTLPGDLWFRGTLPTPLARPPDRDV